MGMTKMTVLLALFAILFCVDGRCIGKLPNGASCPRKTWSATGSIDGKTARFGKKTTKEYFSHANGTKKGPYCAFCFFNENRTPELKCPVCKLISFAIRNASELRKRTGLLPKKN